MKNNTKQFITIYRYELHYWLKNPAFYCYAGLFFLAIWSMIGGMSGETSQRWSGQIMNAPMYVQQVWSRMSVFLYLLVPAIIGLGLYRDYSHRMYSLMYAFPIEKGSYLAAKFLSGLTMLTLILMATGLGFYLGTHMPWSNPDVVGVFRGAAYWQPFLTLMLPNLILVGSVVFAVVLWSRNIYAGFISVILLLVLRAGLSNVLEGSDMAFWAALLDPLARDAIHYYTAYWTVAKLNTADLPIQGMVIYNRLLWMGIVLILAVLMYKKFSFSQEVESFVPFGKKRTSPNSNNTKLQTGGLPSNLGGITKVRLPKVRYDFSFLQQLKTAWYLSSVDFRFVLSSWPFIALVTAGLAFLIFMISAGAIRFDTESLPLTRILLDTPLALFSAVLNIVTFLYAGLLIHRARMANTHQLVDINPIPNWTFLLSKWLALVKVQAFMLSILMIGGIITQISKGFYHFEIGLYLFELYAINLIHFVLWGMLALFIQSIFTNPYLGFFISVLVPVGLIGLMDVGPKIGMDFLEQDVFRYNHGPGSIFGLPYSDMDGYGPSLRPYFLYKIYWYLAGMLLMLGAWLMWLRGLPASFVERLRIARVRFNRKMMLGTLAIATAFLGLGATIFYEANVLNEYYSFAQKRELAGAATKKYRHYRYTPQPKIVEVNVNMHLFPEDRTFRSDGFYWLKNETKQVLDTLIVNYEAGLNHQYEFDRPKEIVSKEIIADEAHFDVWVLKNGLAVGDSMKVDFSLQTPPQTWLRTHNHVKASGTFIRDDIYPRFGNWLDYLRRKLQMNVNEYMPHPSDSLAIEQLHNAKDEGAIRFEAVVSTSPDQMAIAPGYIQREWLGELPNDNHGQRRFFHYKMDKEIGLSYMFASGQYAVKKDKWQDINLEIYYHPDHYWNVDGMMDGMKASLQYCSDNFSPYQFKQIRIVEFSQVGSASAHGYPNTIPYGEEAGFTADIDASPEGGIDFAFGGAVHEVAHQWWGHQVGSVDALGAKMVNESTAEYVTVMVRKHQKGIDKTRQYIKLNMETYLKARTRERKIESPLMLTHPNQNYIHYPKGMIVFYTLADYLGEDYLNQTIKTYVEKRAYGKSGFTTAMDFMEHLKKATPDSLKYLIKDMIETVTLYDNKVVSAKSKVLPNGQYEITIDFLVSKYHSMGKGERIFHNEKNDSLSYQNSNTTSSVFSLPLADFIEIGVFGKDKKELYLKKHTITQIDNQLVLVVDELPEQVAVDPFYLMIDREMGDNWKKIE